MATGSARGFTLIEMIVVIFIIAILSAIAVPSYGRLMARARFNHGVQEVVSLFRWARDAAIESAADTTVRFDTQDATFVAVVPPPEPETDLPSQLLEQEQEQAQDTPEPRAVVLSDNLTVLQYAPFGPESLTEGGRSAGGMRFRPDGSSNGGQIVVAAPEDGYVAQIEIQPTTGRVVVRDAEDAQRAP